MTDPDTGPGSAASTASDEPERPRVVFDGVSLTYGERDVLRDVDLVLAEHRIGVVGSNGSGKSSLLRMINGLQAPTTGRVLVDGIDAAEEGHAVRARVGFLFQNPDAQLVLPTVAEDVALGLTGDDRSPEEHRTDVEAILEQLGIGHLLDRLAHQLSGGEKQLVALGGALIRRPQVLVLDEPTTFLDLHHTGRLMSHVEQLPQTVIVASHDMDVIASCDRVLLVHEGCIAADGPSDKIINRYRGLVRWR